MTCLECGREIRSIGFRHLQSCCGLTPQQYLAKHPRAQLLDDDVRRSIARPGEKNPNWKGGINSPCCRDCGKRLSKHSYLTRCRRCSIRANGNPFQGRTHSEETRARMREAARHRDPTTYKHGVVDSEINREKRKAYWQRIPKDQRVGMLASFIAAGQQHNKRSSNTVIEKRMAALIAELGLPIQPSARVGRYFVDLLVGDRLIIECYGDYWHCNPALYTADDYHASLHMTAGEKWEKDARRKQALEANGCEVVVLWENDIKSDFERVATYLTEVIGKHFGAAESVAA